MKVEISSSFEQIVLRELIGNFLIFPLIKFSIYSMMNGSLDVPVPPDIVIEDIRETDGRMPRVFVTEYLVTLPVVVTPKTYE